jgi:hypothetical protein
VYFESEIGSVGFIIIITEAITECQTNTATIRPTGRIRIQSNRPYIQSTITHSKLTGMTISSTKLQAGGLRVYSCSQHQGNGAKSS